MMTNFSIWRRSKCSFLERLGILCVILLVISLIRNYSYFKTNNLIYPIILHFIHNIYAIIGYIDLNNIIYIVFEVICFAIYILLLKTVAKILLQKIRTRI